ncbi:hypothetical protein PROFUN_10766 [Planoprotostelium fungivorum]|uniref:Uncharacterized protein n=1 Tax=Planoprotostelium fungivorum TaxID=1890364 RepID=A0A2P6N806_9EUKA|nr:hypothetical protein PROFUN_10766 [Planoprotostelium fungivorum]
MCIIVWAQEVHPKYRLVLVANREELFERETSSLHFWDGPTPILAGRDLKAGGTWLGVTQTGRIAALTNYRVPLDEMDKNEAKLSRGELLNDFLNGDTSPRDYMEGVSQNSHKYKDFNLVVGNLFEPLDMVYFGSRDDGGRPQLLKNGKIYGLSNAILDTNWWKLERAKDGVARVLSSESSETDEEKVAEELVERLFHQFADPQVSDQEVLPATGLPSEWERPMSSIFMPPTVLSKRASTYGTRSQAVILVGRDDSVHFVERTMSLKSLILSPTTARHGSRVQRKKGPSWIYTHYDFQLDADTTNREHPRNTLQMMREEKRDTRSAPNTPVGHPRIKMKNVMIAGSTTAV